MRKLTIEAISPEKARALHAALAGFDAELLVDDKGDHSGVAVSFSDGVGEAEEAIGAIQRYLRTES